MTSAVSIPFRLSSSAGSQVIGTAGSSSQVGPAGPPAANPDRTVTVTAAPQGAVMTITALTGGGNSGQSAAAATITVAQVSTQLVAQTTTQTVTA